jgi:hypothetical protein
MKYAALALGLMCGLLLMANGASAQASAVNPLLFAVPSPLGAATQYSLFPLPAAAGSAAGAAAEPQGVQGVFANYTVEVYGGYTYFRFYEAPHLAANMNGFNFSGVYYPRDWVGLDGELAGTFGSQGGTSTQFFMGVAGPRFRWTSRRGFELWAHGMAGGAHFSPQTPFGSQEAFAFEAGGGIDLSSRHKRFAYRVSADLVGTSYFSTYQLSPKISTGIVYKF